MIGRNLTDAVDGILKGKRLRFTDDQRRRLAVKAKGLGRKVLLELGTPDTLWPGTAVRVLESRWRERCRASETACAKSEFERLRGAVCADDQGVVPVATDPVW